MLAVADMSRPEHAGLPRVLPGWGVGLWVLSIAVLWWLAMDTGMGEMMRRRELEIPETAMRLGVLVAVAGKFVTNLAETAFYTSWWAVRGPRLPFGAVWLWLVSLSLLDTFGVVAAGFEADLDGSARMVVASLCNGRLLLPPSTSESHLLSSALAGVSVLAVVRIVATAWVQARAARRPLASALALTTGGWLATRLLLVVATLLLRGPAAAMEAS